MEHISIYAKTKVDFWLAQRKVSRARALATAQVRQQFVNMLYSIDFRSCFICGSSKTYR